MTLQTGEEADERTLVVAGAASVHPAAGHLCAERGTLPLLCTRWLNIKMPVQQEARRTRDIAPLCPNTRRRTRSGADDSAALHADRHQLAGEKRRGALERWRA